LNSLGLFSAFQYLKFLVSAKVSFNWSIAVFIAIGVIFAFIVYDFVLSRGIHYYYMADLLIVEKHNMPVFWNFFFLIRRIRLSCFVLKPKSWGT